MSSDEQNRTTTDSSTDHIPPSDGNGSVTESAPGVWGYVGNMVTAVTGPLTFRNGLTWVGLIGFVLAFRWLVMEPFSIPTGSMEPTLHGDPRFLRGDRIAVNKFIYGPRVPFMNKRLFHWGEPKRWDIVVFHSLDPRAVHPTLVKRVVGLPGERIHVANGKIEVNSTPVEPPAELQPVLDYTTQLECSDENLQTFILQMIQHDAVPPWLSRNSAGLEGLEQELRQMHEELNGRAPSALTPPEIENLFKKLSPASLGIIRSLFSAQQAAQYPLRYGVETDERYSLVPPNCYLVMGDNSGDSVDGRYFGWLPNDYIYGRATCIWWPIDRWRDFTGYSRTWWGKLLLYGPPLLLAAYEIGIRILRRRA